MTFKDLLEKLNNGKTFEECVVEFVNANNLELPVECCDNEAYEDDDLYEFLYLLGADFEDLSLGYALIKTSDGSCYQVPYEMRENRFGEDLSDETILFFDVNRILDVTETYK